MIINSRVFRFLSIALILSACGGTQQPGNTSNSVATGSNDYMIMSTYWLQQNVADENTRQAYFLAQKLVNERLGEGIIGKPPAIVIDIDETILDNTEYVAGLIQDNKPHSKERWDTWVREAKCGIKPGSREFLQWARSMGVEVFYLSDRSTDLLESTLENLSQYELPNADPDHTFLSNEVNDRMQRREYVKEGYNVVLFIGDQLTDYTETFEEYEGNDGLAMELRNNFVLIPNPMGINFASTESFDQNDNSISAETLRNQLKTNR